MELIVKDIQTHPGDTTGEKKKKKNTRLSLKV